MKDGVSIVGHGSAFADWHSKEQNIRVISCAAVSTEKAAALTIDYPLDATVFPPDIVSPTLLWRDETAAGEWLISITVGTNRLDALTPGPSPTPSPIDPACIRDYNKNYKASDHHATVHSWRPSSALWEAIKKIALGKDAELSIVGFPAGKKPSALSRNTIRFSISTDPVAAPIFYRDVPLLPGRNKKGVIKPLEENALPLIAWRLRHLDQEESKVILKNMPTCANCHSFSQKANILAMDIDGPEGDKGAYAIAPLTKDTVIDRDQIITWNSFKGKPDASKTIGFLSRISPDGRYVISTVNEKVYVANFIDYKFLQVFYPTRGILAYYSCETREIKALPGADNTNFVHCGGVWTPDGKTVIFSRTKAIDPYIKGRKIATHANDPNETPIQYDLYRLSFNNGRGEKPEAIKGASKNGLSNTFPKVTPDGRFIVFVKCRNGQLMRPDSELWIVPVEGGEARRMRCNTSLMNSWHSFSPNGRWMVFSSKSRSPFTQMFLTHLDKDGNDTPAVFIPNSTAANRAVNLPEFVNLGDSEFNSISVPYVEHYRYFESGKKLADAGNYTAAIKKYRLALKGNPSDSRINIEIGLALCRSGKAPEGLKHFHRVLEVSPEDVPTHNNIAAVYASKGHYSEALRCYNKALEIDANQPAIFCNRGDIKQRTGKLNSAFKDYSRAIKLDPGFARAYKDRGSILSMKKRYADAIKDFQACLKVAPKDWAARPHVKNLLQRAKNNLARQK